MKSKVLTVILIFVLTVQMAVFSMANYSNLSSDPGCELGKLKLATITEEEQHSGDKSYKVNFTKTWTNAIEDNQVKFEALKTYYCSAWIKTEKPVENFSLAFAIGHKIDGAITELTMTRKTLEKTDSWQRITFKYKVDKKKVNKQEVAIESGDVLTDTKFFISAASAPTEGLPQTVYIDDIEIREVPDTTEKMYANIKEQGKIISHDQKVVLEIDNLIDIWSVKSENIKVNGLSVNLISVEMDEENGVSRITISPKTSWTPNAENSVLITELKNAWGGKVSADGTLSGSFSTLSNITTNKYSNLSSDPGCELGKLKLATITEEEQHSGDKSYKVNFTKTWTNAIEDNQVKFEALKTYYCSAWIKTEKPVENFSLAFAIGHKIDGAITELTMTRKTLEKTDSWQRITFKYKVDKKKVNKQEVAIESGDVLTDTKFFISAASAPTEGLPQTVYIDDIEIREVPDAPEKMYANIKQGQSVSPDKQLVLELDNFIDVWSVKPENIKINGLSVNLDSVKNDEVNGFSKILISPKKNWIPDFDNSVSITGLKNAWGGDVSVDGTVLGSFYTLDNIDVTGVNGNYLLTNNLTKPIDAIVILTWSKDSRIEKSIVIPMQTIAANGGQKTYSADVSGAPNDCIFRGFVWSSADGMAVANTFTDIVSQ